MQAKKTIHTLINTSLLSKNWLIQLLSIFLLSTLARLPYFLGPHVFFDGDEAMLGIMGRDIVLLKNLPFYFYGQHYGFSLFEALSAAIFIPFFGSTLFSLKAGGLLIFSLAMQQIVIALYTKNKNSLHIFGLVIVLVSFPAWFIWACKLRGGYLSALFFLCFVFRKLYSETNWDFKTWIYISLSCAFITVSQFLFIIPVLGLLFVRFYKLQNRKQQFTLVILGICTLIVLRSLVFLNSEVYSPNFFQGIQWQHYNTYFIDGFLAVFSGNFLYGDVYTLPIVFKVSGFCIAFISILLIALNAFKANQEQKAFLTLLVGIALSSTVVVFFKMSGGRYLLPFYTGLLLALVIALNDLRNSTFTYSAFSFLMLCCIANSFNYYKNYTAYWLEPSANDMQELNTLVSTLKENKQSKLLCCDWFLYWQLNYLGNESMHCRYLESPDRVARFPAAVDSCLSDPGCDVTLVGGKWPLNDMQTVPGFNESIMLIGTRYFIYHKPDKKYLYKAGFIFKP